MFGDTHYCQEQGVTTSLRDKFGCQWIKQRANKWKIQPAASQTPSSHPIHRISFYAVRLQAEQPLWSQKP